MVVTVFIWSSKAFNFSNCFLLNPPNPWLPIEVSSFMFSVEKNLIMFLTRLLSFSTNFPDRRGLSMKLPIGLSCMSRSVVKIKPPCLLFLQSPSFLLLSCRKVIGLGNCKSRIIHRCFFLYHNSTTLFCTYIGKHLFQWGERFFA